jgi:drug/metabolite transporter (DMT)-like permease
LLALATVRPLSVATLVPSRGDWVPLLVLSLVCTVFAFSACVWLQQRISAFTVGLAGNLEPVYGMLLALAVFGSSEQMGPRFYAGAAVIIGCVAVHALGGMRRGGEGSEEAEK